MRHRTTSLSHLAAATIAIGAAAAASGQVSVARYRLDFKATWSAQTHPVDFPANPHFSPLIGGTHNSRVHFWRDGEIATNGIEAMAERGSTGPLRAEIETAITAGTAWGVVQGNGIPRSPGSTSVEFDISSTHPLATIVSMIAPSPDWYVGTESLDLMPGGEWTDTVFFDLYPWDAGTDSGSTYDSADEDTQPREPIHTLTDYYIFEGRPPMGIFTFTLLDVRCAADCDRSGVLDIRDFFCFQSKFAAGDRAADFDGNGILDIRDFFAFQRAYSIGCP